MDPARKEPIAGVQLIVPAQDVFAARVGERKCGRVVVVQAIAAKSGNVRQRIKAQNLGDLSEYPLLGRRKRGGVDLVAWERIASRGVVHNDGLTIAVHRLGKVTLAL